jgi:hypothetical protein
MLYTHKGLAFSFSTQHFWYTVAIAFKAQHLAAKLSQTYFSPHFMNRFVLALDFGDFLSICLSVLYHLSVYLLLAIFFWSSLSKPRIIPCSLKAGTSPFSGAYMTCQHQSFCTGVIKKCLFWHKHSDMIILVSPVTMGLMKRLCIECICWQERCFLF